MPRHDSEQSLAAKAQKAAEDAVTYAQIKARDPNFRTPAELRAIVAEREAQAQIQAQAQAFPQSQEQAAAQQHEGRNPMLTREDKQRLFNIAHKSGLNPDQIRRVSDLIRSGLDEEAIFQNIALMQQEERARIGNDPRPFIDPSEYGRRAQRSLREYEQAERAGNQAAAAFGHGPQVEVKEGREVHHQQQAFAQQQAQEAYQARIREQAEQEARQRVQQQFAEQERARQAAQQAYDASAAQLNREQFQRSFPNLNIEQDPREFAREIPPEISPGNAAAAEAMARAREFAGIDVPAQAAQALDPSAQSSRRDIDPRRAQDVVEIMTRAKQMLTSQPHEAEDFMNRIAFPTQEEMRPLHMARAYGIQDPHYSRAQQSAQMADEPITQGVHRYMNPYQQHVIDRIAEEGNRNLFENILPSIEARYIKLGQHGGRMHHDLGARAVRDIQKEISAQQNQALASGYENAAQNFNLDKARQLEASRMHAILGQQSQASRLSDIAALREAEQESRGFRQNAKDFKHHEANRIRKHPEEMLNLYNQMAQGQPYSTTTQTYTPSSPQSLHRKDYQRAIIPFLTQMGSQFLG
jgi:hypothetical protein